MNLFSSMMTFQREAKRPKVTSAFIFVSLFIFLFAGPYMLVDAEALCAKVSLEIPQELTLERIAFDAKMVITNNVPDKDLTDVRVDVSIQDKNGNIKNDIFFVKVVSMRNINGVDGSGTVMAATAAEIHWLIIPSPGAGGTDPAGVVYWVGATLTYTVSGTEEVVPVNPDQITVKPEAQLILDYFMPYEVLGDDPYTAAVETPEPFPLAVRVLNAGYGPARKLKIDSAQPKITENTQGLLVDFRLLGAAVNDSAVYPSLIVDMGDLESKRIATAYWEMISTLSGTFISFDVKFSHASELGGELTSLIQQTNAHYLVHRVKINLPGRDSRLDFLADTDRDINHLPDRIFESEIPGNSGNVSDSVSPVTTVAVLSNQGRPTPQTPNVKLELATGDSGWIYARLPDPSMGLLRVLDVVRDDGVHLDPHNFWISAGLDENHARKYTFSLLDYRSDGNVTGVYTVVYEKPVADTTPPSTSLIFNGPRTGTDPIYVTPDTTIIFMSSDNEGGSGVASILRKVIGVDPDYTAAYPMSISRLGSAEIEYYGIDRAGNDESVKTSYLYVDDAAPTVNTYIAIPSTFMPQAARGVSATRTMNFMVKATDEMNNLKGTIDIAAGDAFSEARIVKTIPLTMMSGMETAIPWNGKNKDGVAVPTGVYTARLRVTDSLDGGTKSHTSTSEVQVTVAESFKGNPLDPNLSGSQMYPKLSGTQVVWQDKRNGNWDIFLKDVNGSNSIPVTSNPADQTRPSISGNTVVWEDNRNGNQDIYGYDLSAGREFVVCNDPGNQERPVVSGEWIAWQDDSAGNWDIYAYNLVTQEKRRITSHERDQMHPQISNGILVWEDYRHGLGEIYRFDFSTGTETRDTFNVYNQTFPAISGSTVAWTDQRNGQRDIYFSGSTATETRATYGAGDHSQASIYNDVIAYTDYESGIDDPNLAFYDIGTGTGAKLTANPARQEEPALGAGILAWQDDRDGIFQIYVSDFHIEALPIEAEIRPGFNMIAVGDRLARVCPTASQVIASSTGDLGIERVVAYNSLNGIFMESSPADDIVLLKGMGIGIYASGNGVLDVGDSGETAQYRLLPGMNYIGMLTVPDGYTAYALLGSIGYDNIQSIRRFNSQTGLWETASVLDTANGKAPAGVNFVIQPGDGLIITMNNRVDEWKP